MNALLLTALLLSGADSLTATKVGGQATAPQTAYRQSHGDLSDRLEPKATDDRVVTRERLGSDGLLKATDDREDFSLVTQIGNDLASPVWRRPVVDQGIVKIGVFAAGFSHRVFVAD